MHAPRRAVPPAARQARRTPSTASPTRGPPHQARTRSKTRSCTGHIMMVTHTLPGGPVGRERRAAGALDLLCRLRAACCGRLWTKRHVCRGLGTGNVTKKKGRPSRHTCKGIVISTLRGGQVTNTHTPPTTVHPAQTAFCPADRTGVRSDRTPHSTGSARDSPATATTARSHGHRPPHHRYTHPPPKPHGHCSHKTGYQTNTPPPHMR